MITKEQIQILRALAPCATEKGRAAILAALDTLNAQAAQHHDDMAVDAFAAAMKAKMAASRAKGRSGWDNPAQCTIETLQQMLLGHLSKGDPVDVANFAMMLHHRKAPVVAPAPARELSDEEERAAFENWIKEKAQSSNYAYMASIIKRDPSGCYATTWVDSAWMGWQARAVLATKVQS